MEITQNLRWALNEYKKGNNQAFTYVYEESKRYGGCAINHRGGSWGTLFKEKNVKCSS